MNETKSKYPESAGWSHIPMALLQKIVAHPQQEEWRYDNGSGNVTVAVHVRGVDDRGRPFDRVDFYINVED